MTKTMSDFCRYMRSDRAFRQRILEAWKSGDLGETLLAEGYAFSLDELLQGMPRVRTGIRAGSCSHNFTCACGP